MNSKKIHNWQLTDEEIELINLALLKTYVHAPFMRPHDLRIRKIMHLYEQTSSYAKQQSENCKKDNCEEIDFTAS